LENWRLVLLAKILKNTVVILGWFYESAKILVTSLGVSQYTLKKIYTFCYEISKIIIFSRRAGSTLQEQSLLYKTQKNKSKRKKKKCR
jgi:hypothetical protein